MTTAIRDASVSLQRRLEAWLTADADVQAINAAVGNCVVSLLTPDAMLGIPERGVSLWLYKITRDEFTANLPPRRVSPNRLQMTPLPLRLHYLATPVVELAQGAAAPEYEQTLLGKVLQHFADEPFLRGASLTGGLASGGRQLTVRLEQLSTEEITRIWDALEGEYRLSVSYEVTIVPVESRREIMSGPPVGVVANSYGVASLEEVP